MRGLQLDAAMKAEVVHRPFDKFLASAALPHHGIWSVCDNVSGLGA
ncbi:hypothetical protein [Methylocella tundrae]|nr:hypothetical protein [Methylocella tundrae]WPP02934.1 hypothetical protein SIN04_02165 [Methylocella tundrae]